MKEKKKFFERKWFMWLTLFVMPPVGIGLIWTVNKKMRKVFKIGLTTVFAFWFIIIVIGITAPPSADDSASASSGQSNTEEVAAYTNDVDSIKALFGDVFKKDIDEFENFLVKYDDITESYLVEFYPTASFWDENAFVRNNLTTYIDFCKEAYTIDGVDSIFFRISTTMTDAKGNEIIEDVMDIRMSKASFDTFNWDNMEYASDTYDTIKSNCDFYWLHPGILSSIDSSDIYYAP